MSEPNASYHFQKPKIGVTFGKATRCGTRTATGNRTVETGSLLSRPSERRDDETAEAKGRPGARLALNGFDRATLRGWPGPFRKLEAQKVFPSNANRTRIPSR